MGYKHFDHNILPLKVDWTLYLHCESTWWWSSQYYDQPKDLSRTSNCSQQSEHVCFLEFPVLFNLGFYIQFSKHCNSKNKLNMFFKLVTKYWNLENISEKLLFQPKHHNHFVNGKLKNTLCLTASFGSFQFTRCSFNTIFGSFDLSTKEPYTIVTNRIYVDW